MPAITCGVLGRFRQLPPFALRRDHITADKTATILTFVIVGIDAPQTALFRPMPEGTEVTS